MVMGIANLAMATGNLGREGVGVNPLRGQNNVQGSCDMGSFPHELPGYRHVLDDATRGALRDGLGRAARAASRACAFPTCSTPRSTAASRRSTCEGEDIAQSDPNTQHVTAALERDGVHRRAGPLPERDGEVRPRLPARVVVPREGRHLHQRRAPHLAGAQGDAAAWRARRTGRSPAMLSQRAGLPHDLQASVRDHGRDRAAHADLHRRELREDRPARAASSGPATTRRPRARRSCTRSSSCAARASSCSPSTCRPRRR